MIDFKVLTNNYRERVGRIVLFDCFSKLENKKGKDKDGNPIDYFGLGLLSLLFFFENMLLRKKNNGVKQLAVFLEINCKDKVNETSEGFYKIAESIIEIFRPSSGKRNSKTFYNWETGEDDILYYTILKTEGWNKDTNEQYYTLDEAGLDLIFATKEYYSEFHLSINQLVLRKQLEKGEFVGALRQVDEMRIDVNKIEDRMNQIKHDIQRNIISEETYEKYKTLIEDVYLRLNRENEEFKELKAFVRETKIRLGNELTSDKDQKAYELIIVIDKELSSVHYAHTELLNKSIKLKTTALEVARESLYYVGMDTFNFDTEIVRKITSTPLPIKLTRTLLKPMLYLEQKEQWSPITVFAKQRVAKGDKEVSKEIFIENEEEVLSDHDVIEEKNIKQIVEILFEAIGDDNEITFNSLIEYITTTQQKHLLENKMFYHFFIVLHQYSPIALGEIVEEENEKNFIEQLTAHIGDRVNNIEVSELDENIEVTERFSFKNMLIRLEYKENV